jgi:hypothetical protein
VCERCLYHPQSSEAEKTAEYCGKKCLAAHYDREHCLEDNIFRHGPLAARLHDVRAVLPFSPEHDVLSYDVYAGRGMLNDKAPVFVGTISHDGDSRWCRGSSSLHLCTFGSPRRTPSESATTTPTTSSTTLTTTTATAANSNTTTIFNNDEKSGTAPSAWTPPLLSSFVSEDRPAAAGLRPRTSSLHIIVQPAGLPVPSWVTFYDAERRGKEGDLHSTVDRAASFRFDFCIMFSSDAFYDHVADFEQGRKMFDQEWFKYSVYGGYLQPALFRKLKNEKDEKTEEKKEDEKKEDEKNTRTFFYNPQPCILMKMY